MTAKEYVLRAAFLKGWDVCKPTKQAPEILVYDWSTGKGVCVAESPKWEEVKAQMSLYSLKRAA